MSDRSRQARDFAAQVANSLVSRGLPDRLVRLLMRETGPGKAVAALDWAEKIASEWSGSPASQDAIRIVFQGLPAKFGVRRHLNAFEVLELVPPPPGRSLHNGDLFALIKGVQVILDWCLRETSQSEEDES